MLTLNQELAHTTIFRSQSQEGQGEEKAFPENPEKEWN